MVASGVCNAGQLSPANECGGGGGGSVKERSSWVHLVG